MLKNKNNFYYEQEIVALIKSGVEPAEAKKIADAHLAAGNYDKIIEKVAKDRKDEKELQSYARKLSARIKAGENPQDVVNDMKDDERER